MPRIRVNYHDIESIEYIMNLNRDPKIKIKKNGKEEVYDMIGLDPSTRILKYTPVRGKMGHNSRRYIMKVPESEVEDYSLNMEITYSTPSRVVRRGTRRIFSPVSGKKKRSRKRRGKKSKRRRGKTRNKSNKNNVKK